MVMLEKNPSGGYRTNGIDKEGVITREVPGGSARRPSGVSHSSRFCLECGADEAFVSGPPGTADAETARSISSNHITETKMGYLNNSHYCI